MILYLAFKNRTTGEIHKSQFHFTDPPGPGIMEDDSKAALAAQQNWVATVEKERLKYIKDADEQGWDFVPED